MSNQFKSDGSFLSSFLKSNTENSHTAEGAAQPSWKIPDHDGEDDETAEVYSSDTRKRRFSETAPKAEKPKRSKFDESEECGTSSGADLTAADIQYDAVKHLNPGDPIEDKDTYEQCVESGGVIEGGTWEHRKRAREMIKTANLAATVTEVSRAAKQSGGAGIGGYLPPEIAAMLEGKADFDEDTSPSGKSLSNTNKGYRMLQQAGWQEGKGLGADASGITKPVEAVEKKIFSGKPSESNSSDTPTDVFEQYRKRMMMAYRFRPNPLNNPRRSYDGYDTLYDNSKIDATLQKIRSAAQIQKS